MVLFDKFMDLFCDHAAIINDDPQALQKEVDLLKKTYGPWFRIRGFTNYRQLFLALKIAKAKRRPFSVAFIRDTEPEAGEIVLKRSEPTIKTFKYSDTQELATHLPVLR